MSRRSSRTTCRSNELLDAPTWPDRSGRGAWLGDAVAIKDPTAAVFRPSAGNNLLIVGQQDEAALAVMAATIVSLARSIRPDGDQVVRPRRHAGRRPATPASCRGVAAVLPPVRLIDRTDLGAGARAQWPRSDGPAEEARARTGRRASCSSTAPHRFRDLRKEDDFGFGRRGAEQVPRPSTSPTILAMGRRSTSHVILWADSPTNLPAWSTGPVREFGLRVLFQMGVNDSSTLIDSPAASRSGETARCS